MSNKFFLYLMISMCLSTSVSLHGKTIVDSKVRMVDGDYATLSDFYTQGVMIINFWTTW